MINSIKLKLFSMMLIAVTTSIIFGVLANMTFTSVKELYLQHNQREIPFLREVEKLNKKILLVQVAILQAAIEGKNNLSESNKLNTEIKGTLSRLKKLEKNFDLSDSNTAQLPKIMESLERRYSNFFSIAVSFPEIMQDMPEEGKYEIEAVNEMYALLKKDMNALNGVVSVMDKSSSTTIVN